jgi:hypothetical protein
VMKWKGIPLNGQSSGTVADHSYKILRAGSSGGPSRAAPTRSFSWFQVATVTFDSSLTTKTVTAG